MKKIVFFGTPDYAVPTLEKFYNDKNFEIVYVVTKPDAKSSRGQKVSISDVKKKALEYKLNILQPESIKDNIDFTKKMIEANADFFVVVAYGKILPKEILEIPKYSSINGHASLLPKYRGASPIQSAILNGDVETGITTMLMDIGMDTGDILEQIKIKLDKKENSYTLFNKLSILNADLMLHTLENFDLLYENRKKQNENESSKAIIIKKEYGNINFDEETYDEIDRKVRGYYYWPSAYFVIDDIQYKVLDVDECNEEIKNNLYLIYSYLIDKSFGRVEDKMYNTKFLYKLNNNVFALNNVLYAKCKNSFLIINRIKKSGKNEMQGSDFINGLKG